MQPLNLIVHNTSHNCCIGWAGMQEMNSTVQHCIWADLTRWEGLGTLKCSSLFYVTNLPLLQIKTHCSVIRIYWIEPFSSNIFLHGSWLWERCIAWFLALREMYQVWFVIVRLHLKLRLNNSIFLVGVTSEGGKCLSAKVMFLKVTSLMVLISANRLSGPEKSQMSPVSTVVCIVFL